jgi:hypothetical protein
MAEPSPPSQKPLYDARTMMAGRLSRDRPPRYRLDDAAAGAVVPWPVLGQLEGHTQGGFVLPMTQAEREFFRTVADRDATRRAFR